MRKLMCFLTAAASAIGAAVMGYALYTSRSVDAGLWLCFLIFTIIPIMILGLAINYDDVDDIDDNPNEMLCTCTGVIESREGTIAIHKYNIVIIDDKYDIQTVLAYKDILSVNEENNYLVIVSNDGYTIKLRCDNQLKQKSAYQLLNDKLAKAV